MMPAADPSSKRDLYKNRVEGNCKAVGEEGGEVVISYVKLYYGACKRNEASD
jgi:hypothetical protein